MRRGGSSLLVSSALASALGACSVYGTSLLLPGDAPDGSDGNSESANGDATVGSGGSGSASDAAGGEHDASEEIPVAFCGDGRVDPGEQCDLGTENGKGKGCEADCTAKCMPGPAGDAQCDDHDLCNGVETCTESQLCAHGMPLADGTSCGTDGSCRSGVCVPRCGNGSIDDGEECDPPGTPTCDAQCRSICDVSGKWALEQTLPVHWTTKLHLLVLDGDGTFTTWTLIDRAVSGTTVTESGTLCGIAFPRLTSIILGNHTPIFPMPLPFDASFSREPTFDRLVPGGNYTTPVTPVLMGVKLADPVADAWPTSATLVANAPKSALPYASDDDRDGLPGVTVRPTSPIPPLTGALIDHVYLSLRLVTRLDGTLDDCNSMAGRVDLRNVDRATVGCSTSGGRDCSAGSLDYIENNLPVYQPSGKPTFVMRKLSGPDATCADAISAFK